MTAIVHTLLNGLTVIAEPNKNAVTAGAAFFVRTGARDEAPSVSGVSHFLEHMMFKGCKNHPGDGVNFALGDLGAQTNAYTSEEVTVYYSHVLPEFIEQAFLIHTAMFQPLFEPEAFEMERKVVLEELALYEDKPSFVLLEKALQDFFGTHPAGNTVIGTRASLASLTPSMMAEYFSARYVPSNTVLVLAGNFDWGRMKGVVEAECGKWSGPSASRTLDPRKIKFGGLKLTKSGLNHADIAYFTDGPSAASEDRTSMGLITSMLGGSEGSRLYRALVDPGYAESASVDYDDRDGVGLIVAEAECSPENLEKVKEIVASIVKRPPSFSEEELYRAKKRIRTRAVFGGELPMGRLMFLGNEWLYRKRTLNLSEILSEIDEINLNNINETLERYPLREWSEYILAPE